MLKKIIILSITAVLFAFSAYAAVPALKAGDCITPTDISYSWHGVFAKVEAVSTIEGHGPEKRYILSFRRYVSNSAIFNTEIDEYVKQVAKHICDAKLR